ncbi:phosphatase PAP2 family protein [Oleiharenicola lentus]|uniref:Phosphatase PAP2 family protein n=2 Tax=Oleiharenicola lentus TaxID=2508720 RepID=A0A4Q1C6N5_9BACT|nr:phosphatase PAP2 family protein [Oleiharenicola lentus]
MAMTRPLTGFDRTLGPAVLVLAVALACFELTGTDLWLQDRFYDPGTGRWLVDAADPLGRLVFYDGPKGLIILTAVALLVLALGPARWRERWRFGRRDLWVAVLTLVSVPVLAGWGKDTTNTFCPSEIRRYGGDVPYVKVFERYPENDRPARRGRGFPAGHASGGFALLGLMWLRRSSAWRLGGLALGLGAGWWMGGYQMLKGAHFLSHTIVTMLLAWIVMLLWRRVVRPAGSGL